MVPPLSFADRICLASRLLSDRPSLPVTDIQRELSILRETHACGLGFSHDIREEAQAIAQDIAAPVNPSELGREDLYRVLGQLQYGLVTENIHEDPYMQAILRDRLGFPQVDPEGVQLGFYQIPHRDASQVFYVSIQPEHLDPSKSPLVFVTGLHHPTVVYLPMLAALARAEGRRVISVDLPSMGGSRIANQAATYVSDALRSVREVIEREIPRGGHFSMMGHSLGTLPVRAFYLNEQEYNSDLGSRDVRRVLDRAVLVAPVPSQEERQMGDRIRPSFSAGVVGQILFAGGRVGPTRLNELFFQHHSAADQEWLSQAISQERFETSLWGALSHYFSAYLNPLLNRVGEDERLRIVFPSDDQLMQMSNQSDWENHRGVLIVRGEQGEAADHSFLAGQHVDSHHLEVLRSALNNPLNPSQERLSRGELYRHLRPDLQAYSLFDTRGGFGAGLRAGMQSGLAPLGPLGLRFQAGAEVDLRLPASSEDPGVSSLNGSLTFANRSAAQGRIFTELAFESLHLPFQLGLGAYAQSSTPLSDFNLNNNLGAYTFLRIMPENLVSIDARFDYPIYSWNGVNTPPTFQFRVGIPLAQ